jgi:hypothetical protein
MHRRDVVAMYSQLGRNIEARTCALPFQPLLLALAWHGLAVSSNDYRQQTYRCLATNRIPCRLHRPLNRKLRQELSGTLCSRSSRKQCRLLNICCGCTNSNRVPPTPASIDATRLRQNDHHVPDVRVQAPDTPSLVQRESEPESAKPAVG